jgi:hypothetical protein
MRLQTRRIISITVIILFMVGAIVSTGGDLPTDGSGRCVPPGTGAFAAATILFIITVIFQIASYILLEATSVAGPEKALAQESGIATGKPAEPLDNGDQKEAAGGDLPPPSAPAALSEVSIDPSSSPHVAHAASSEANVDSPAHSVPAMSPKASAIPTNQV